MGISSFLGLGVARLWRIFVCGRCVVRTLGLEELKNEI